MRSGAGWTAAAVGAGLCGWCGERQADGRGARHRFQAARTAVRLERFTAQPLVVCSAPFAAGSSLTTTAVGATSGLSLRWKAISSGAATNTDE